MTNEAFSPPGFDAGVLEQYKKLKERITECESQNTEQRAAAARQHLQQVEAKFKHADGRLRATEEAQAEAQKKLEKLDNWYPGKLVMGEKKRDAKHDEREKSLQDAAKAVQMAQEQLVAAKTELQQANQSWKDFDLKVQKLNSDRREREELIKSIFSSPEWLPDPTLSSLRAEIESLNAKAAEYSQHRATYQRGRDFLSSSNRKINEALQALQRTRMMGAVEMGVGIASPLRRPAGSLMMDMSEMLMVERANELVKSSAGDYLAAKRILPSLPFQNDSAVQAARAGVFVSLLAPGLMGDVAQQMMIKKSMITVSEIRNGVQQCLQYCDRNIDAITLDVNRIQSDSGAKSSKMSKYQYSKLDAAVCGT